MERKWDAENRGREANARDLRSNSRRKLAHRSKMNITWIGLEAHCWFFNVIGNACHTAIESIATEPISTTHFTNSSIVQFNQRNNWMYPIENNEVFIAFCCHKICMLISMYNIWKVAINRHAVSLNWLPIGGANWSWNETSETFTAYLLQPTWDIDENTHTTKNLDQIKQILFGAWLQNYRIWCVRRANAEKKKSIHIIDNKSF